MLFHLLRNPIYLGQIRHKGVVHDGGHEAIVAEDLFARVQHSLDGHAPRKRKKGETPQAKSHLTGKLFDAHGEVMSPVHTRGRGGTLYRYYVSASLQQGSKVIDDGVLRRIAATDLEKALAVLIARWLPQEPSPLAIITAVHVREDGLLIDLSAGIEKDLAPNLRASDQIIHADTTSVRLKVPLQLPLRGGQRLVIAGHAHPATPDAALISALRKAHRMVIWKRGLPSLDTAPTSPYDRYILRLAFLAPDLQRDILAGRQPPTLTLEKLKTITIPIDWRAQRDALGWHPA